jgi:hypothetical protein
MKEKNSTKFVRAELNNHDIVVFRLLQGVKRPRAVHSFGYAPRYKIWLQIYNDGASVSYVAESAAEVKEQIAAWR